MTSRALSRPHDFAPYLEHAGMQSRGSKGGGEVCGGRASGSLVSPVTSMARRSSRRAVSLDHSVEENRVAR